MILQYYLLALLVAVFSVIVLLLRRIYFHPLSHFPGPRLATTSSFVQFYILKSGKEKAWYRDLHEKYGPIVRCGPNHLHFNDPELVPIVYHRQADKSGYPKDFTNQGAASSKVDHVGFAVAKRQFGQAYTWSRVKHFEGAIDSEMEKWISILHEEAIKSPVMSEGQWSTWVGYFGMDAFTLFSWGETFGFLDTKSDIRNLIGSSYKIYPLQTWTRYPPVAWFARHTTLGRRVFARMISRRSDEEGVGLFIDEVHKVIQRRINPSVKDQKPQYENTMLDQWLSPRKAIPLQDVEDQIVTDLLGGPIAASATFTGIIFHLASHPAIMKRMQAEVDQAFDKNHFSTSSIPTYDECLALPFVSACIRESLRYNATSSPRGRCTPDRSLTLNGKYVPPGTSVSTSPHAISTHQKLYGDDAAVFRPERWLEASDEQLRAWRTLDAHWGFGVRKCPGRHIGSMILWKSLVQLLRKFDVALEDSGTALVLVPRNL